jgi:hypothetical protein
MMTRIKVNSKLSSVGGSASGGKTQKLSSKGGSSSGGKIST